MNNKSLYSDWGLSDVLPLAEFAPNSDLGSISFLIKGEFIL